MPRKSGHPLYEVNLSEPISMRVKDACRYTGISRSTLYLLIASGDVEIINLRASKLENQIVFFNY